LDQAAHDVDRGIVAIEQAGGGDEAQRALTGGRVGVDSRLSSSIHAAFRSIHGQTAIVARRAETPRRHAATCVSVLVAPLSRSDAGRLHLMLDSRAAWRAVAVAGR